MGKFQSCRCDGGWGGNDCSLRQCPRGDDPETACDEDLGNDVQVVECDNLFATKEAYFKLRFTNQLGHRYNTRAVVVPLTLQHLPTRTALKLEPSIRRSQLTVSRLLWS